MARMISDNDGDEGGRGSRRGSLPRDIKGKPGKGSANTTGPGGVIQIGGRKGGKGGKGRGGRKGC